MLIGLSLTEATKKDLRAQLRSQDEVLDDVRQQMNEIRSMLVRVHQMPDLTTAEENELWLMSVLPQVADEVTLGFDRLFLKYDENHDGNLSFHELAMIALDAIKKSDVLIEVRAIRESGNALQSVCRVLCWPKHFSTSLIDRVLSPTPLTWVVQEKIKVLESQGERGSHRHSWLKRAHSILQQRVGPALDVENVTTPSSRCDRLMMM